MARAKTLRFTGKYGADGQPDRWFMGVPARDLDAAEVRGLSDDDYRNITGGDSPLYVDAATAAPKAAPRKPAATAKKAPQKPKATATKRAASAPAGAEATPGGDAPEVPAP